MQFPMVVRSGSVTIKIYRVQNKGRDSFTISYFSEGKRRLKMFAKFEEAHAEATSKAISLSKGELEVLHLGRAERLAYVHTLDALKPTGVPMELAAKEYAEAWKLLGGKTSIIEAVRDFAKRRPHAMPIKPLPDAVNEMLAAKEREGTGKPYLKILRSYLGKLSQAFPGPLASVTTSEIGDFLRQLEVSGRSKNNTRASFGAFFKFCRERGWLPKDHDGIALLPKFKQSSNEIEIFTPSELKRFLRHSRPELVPFLAIGAFAGLRSAEIERLDWNEVHLADGFIEVKAAKAKTASRRLVPIQPNLAAWLTPCARSEGRVIPFSNMAKQISWLVEDTQAGMLKAGEDVDPTAEVAWRKNALRHSYISYRVAETQNVNQVALECGNSSSVIFSHYRELVRPAESKQWFGILPEVSRLNPQTHQSQKVPDADGDNPEPRASSTSLSPLNG